MPIAGEAVNYIFVHPQNESDTENEKRAILLFQLLDLYTKKQANEGVFSDGTWASWDFWVEAVAKNIDNIFPSVGCFIMTKEMDKLHVDVSRDQLHKELSKSAFGCRKVSGDIENSFAKLVDDIAANGSEAVQHRKTILLAYQEEELLKINLVTYTITKELVDATLTPTEENVNFDLNFDTEDIRLDPNVFAKVEDSLRKKMWDHPALTKFISGKFVE
ncbi:hypothetical protein PVAR5_4341 [Paecilomyces variotii No. 5]|uniref:Uncharacterized protein n=1 Tax=Byssochlamys spectabilis (strain No. 5 / NBRC 109023) TaxID=1356009 RepID=V5I006_BYSSN|nr:hypothetical protein PVAR5_4341 [Paecilomyces variotii No. 5]